jgi:hypothetical protein
MGCSCSYIAALVAPCIHSNSIFIGVFSSDCSCGVRGSKYKWHYTVSYNWKCFTNRFAWHTCRAPSQNIYSSLTTAGKPKDLDVILVDDEVSTYVEVCSINQGCLACGMPDQEVYG